MIYKKIIYLIILLILPSNILSAKIEILVHVDDQIITNYDIKKETAYLEILNPNLSQLDTIKKNKIAKDSLINQTIKKKQIDKLIKIKHEKTELIDSYLNNLYFNLGLKDKRELEIILKEKNSYTISEIIKKIEIEILWNELIFSKFSNQLKIDKNKIFKKVNNLKDQIEREYLLSEIIFNKKKNVSIYELYNEIKQSILEIGFDNTAIIYSKSDSAKFGGKIGWISEIGLSEELLNSLKKLSKNETSELIKIGNNYLIFRINDIRTKKIILDKEKEFQKLFNLEQNKQLNKFSNIYFNKTKLNFTINEK
jgi:peptidyl-prolyl cis-trans isomerase SurA